MVYRFCMICKQHLKVDGCNTITPFWDIPEGQWWRKILLLSGTSGSSSGCSLCLKGEMTRHANVHWFMAYDQWFDRMVRDLALPNLSTRGCSICLSIRSLPKCFRVASTLVHTWPRHQGRPGHSNECAEAPCCFYLCLTNLTATDVDHDFLCSFTSTYLLWPNLQIFYPFLSFFISIFHLF